MADPAPSRHSSPRGTAASLTASVLFGVIFYLADLIDVSAEVAFAWRMVAAALAGAALLCLPGARRTARDYWARLTRAWWLLLAFVGLSAALGVQLWLFIWGPVHGHALDVSLGYLLLPICLVLVGHFVFRSHVSVLQWSAVAIAVVAVLVQLAVTWSFSWVTAVICLGYAGYFAVRRRLRLDTAASFFAECTALLPVAVWFLTTGTPPSTTHGALAVTGIAVLGTAAMFAFLAASTLLSMPVFGLLGYAEPVLLFVVALLLGERLGPVDVVVYSLLAVALTLVAADSVQSLRQVQRKLENLAHGQGGRSAGGEA